MITHQEIVDYEKILAFAGMVRKLDGPDLRAPESIIIGGEIEIKLVSFADWIEKQADKLSPQAP